MKANRRFVLLVGLLALVCVMAFPSIVAGATYFVRTRGNDENSGLRPRNAFETVKHAAQVARSGDTVYVGAGVYTDDVFINGLQRSLTRTRFIADSAGAFTGDRGDVVFRGAMLKVINSNYIGISGFKFQGDAAHSLVWKGSYEGQLDNCEFQTGRSGLLIKDGSLTIDECAIERFSHDGIQVDGKAEVTIRNSTISGCEAKGVEIRKACRITFENCRLLDNEGDAVDVFLSDDTLDDGPDGGGPELPIVPLVVGRERIRLSSLAHITGWLTTGGGGAEENDDEDSGDEADEDDDDDFHYLRRYWRSRRRRRVNDNSDVYSDGEIALTGRSRILGDVYHGPEGSVNAARDSSVTGSVTALEAPIVLAPVSPGTAATENDNSRIPRTSRGREPLNSQGQFRLWGIDKLDLPGGTYYFSRFELSGASRLQLSGPTVIYVTGDVLMSGLNIVNYSSQPADLQLYPMGSRCDIGGIAGLNAVIYGPTCRINLQGFCSVNGMVVGKEIVAGGWSSIRVDESLRGFASQLMSETSSTDPKLPLGWEPIADAELNLEDSTVRGNGGGVRVRSAQRFTCANTRFIDNGTWGLQLRGHGQVDDSEISGNRTGGLWLSQMTDDDIQVNNLVCRDNGQYGLYAEDCQLSFDSRKLSHWVIDGSDYIFVGYRGELTFEGVSISGGRSAGVLSHLGSLSVRNSNFTDNGYGIAADRSTVRIEGTNLSRNSVGLYANHSGSLSVRGSTIRDNSLWGVSIYAPEDAGATAVLDRCTVEGNTGGISVVNAAEGQILLQSDTVIQDNVDKGLHLEGCTLTLDGTYSSWRCRRNGFGISSSRSTLNLSHLQIEDSTQYGILCHDSNVSVNRCDINGPGGIYAGAGNDSLEVVGSTFVATQGSTHWGVIRYGGNLAVRNCVLNGFMGGLYLSGSGADVATVANATIANVSTYGVRVDGGTAIINNTIIAGTQARQGLTQESGQVSHSHNLLYGFQNTFVGTSQDDTEVVKNPRFVNAVEGDLHLAKGSPAINQGMDMGMELGVDIDGNLRPSFEKFEIGAFEFTSRAGSLRILTWQEKR